uniref:phospholipid-transporting ATPase ABCA3-like n=1 Tax=Jaculus jaculus TaxID=51337 RepID=UPI001E1B16E6|nr:phospholipid-transporting ATPase ABCA3-like [Jaculus jaculus]
MAFLGLSKLWYLLWKNFTLKKRQFYTLLIEIALTILCGITLLEARHFIVKQKIKNLTFSSYSVSDVPMFIQYPMMFTYPLELAYVPSNVDVVKSIVEHVKDDLSSYINVVGFSTEKNFEDYVKNPKNYGHVLAAIVFDHDFKSSHDPLPRKVKYYLRFATHLIYHEESFMGEESWFIDSLFPTIPSLGPRNVMHDDGGSPGYISEGFLAVQHALDKAIMLHHGGPAAKSLFDEVSVLVERFPYPLHQFDLFSILANIFIPLAMVCIFCINHLTLVQSIVSEKEKQLKEYQLILGLSNWMLWTAYFLTFLCLYCIHIIFMCIILFFKVKPEPILQYSDPTLVFTFLLFYAISSILFSIMISTFFNSVHFAVGLGGLLYFTAYIPSIKVSLGFATMSFKQKLASCLSFNVVMSLGFKFILTAEAKKTGIKWRDVLAPKSMDNLLFTYFLGMFLLDAFLYGLVAWYIEMVFPGKYGVPKPWNFFMMRSYWFGETPKKGLGIPPYYKSIQSKYFEVEPTNMVTGIQIQHLSKVFKKGYNTKIAIKDLTLNVYEGQITVLLGHNGAGKSTTLSILSGLFPPTSGEAYICNYDISQNMTEIRKFSGLCPQQNLLFDYLTVSEHLYFYCMMKGASHQTYLQEVDAMLASFNLLEKRHEFSKSLSGGMKRKLSIIIAFIGGSKVVILDEPTSGMDPASRRSTWDLLQSYKQSRTILLTTHHMDEADALGDRIAIMVEGSLLCCGSSIFLKRLYGVGYHIVMVKEPHCHVEEISKLIHHYVPTATLETNVGAELSFILPQNYTHRFEALFNALEEDQQALGIANFGTSITTMEEVFLKVCQMGTSRTENQDLQPLSINSKASNIQQDKNTPSNMRECSPTQDETPSIAFNTGCSLYRQQFHAMFVKKLLYSWRNWKPILVQILGLVISSLVLLKPDTSVDTEGARRQMNLDDYGQTIVPYSISGNSNLTMNLITQLKNMINPKYHKLTKVEGNILNYLLHIEESNDWCIVAFSFDTTESETEITALFNNEAYHSPSLTLAILDNILFMSLSGADASITVSNKPQPTSETAEYITHGSVVTLKLQLGMALLISGFCFLVVTERATKAKHMQFLSGLSMFVYWSSALIYDFIIFFISCCLLLVVFKYHKMNIYVMDHHVLETLLILTLYGWSSIPFIYLLSFLFSESTSAYIKLVIFNYISGVLCAVADSILEDRIYNEMSNTTRAFLRKALLVLPTYNFGKCISEYTVIYHNKIICTQQKKIPSYLNCSKAGIENNIYSFNDKMIGKNLMAMSIAGFFFLLFILFWETYLWKINAFLNQHILFGIYKRWDKDIVSKELSGKSEDEDINDERKRILEQPEEFLSYPVLIKELIKIYFKCPITLAVKNITLAIQKRECFGLLGFNGAGKTTTFKILTGEKPPNFGDVFIDGTSITHNNLNVRSRIGYCPQFDALLEYMTAWEMMSMYARVWGVSESQIHHFVKKYLNMFELDSYANKLISTYSGGNKRKLSTAIALMGKTSAVFLDEPSTGMDPKARRLLWDAVIETRESGKAIILTSHSMEECEALCTRLAIMVKGKLVCLGSPQYLKNKFGNIYILKTKVLSEETLTDFKNFITETFPGSELKQENQKILNYYIPRQDISWGKVFGILEKAKEQFNLEDYSISQITLEQVFLNFAYTDDAEADTSEVP